MFKLKFGTLFVCYIKDNHVSNYVGTFSKT